MIVVLDTNVIVSAILSPHGSPANIIRRWEEDEFEVATSFALIQELRAALAYKRVKKHLKLTTKELDILLKYFESFVIKVDPQEIWEVIKNDPADNRVLECALEASASFIISGYHHLLNLKEFQGIVILPPAGFLKILELETGSQS